jgi:hypothetical protein
MSSETSIIFPLTEYFCYFILYKSSQPVLFPSFIDIREYIDCSFPQPCFGWVVMLPATTLLWHHNQVQKINFIVLFTTNFKFKFWSLGSVYFLNVEHKVRGQNEYMGDLRVFF